MSDGRRVAKNAALMLLKQAILAIAGVVFVGFMARRLGVAHWGELQASLAITAMVSVAAGVGVRGYVAREIAVDPALGPRRLGSALAIRGVTGTVLLGATILVCLFMRSSLGATLVVIAAVSQLANLLYSTMWLSFEAHEEFQYILYVEVSARVFVISAATLLLFAGFGVIAAALVFCAGNVLELALTYHFVRTRLYKPIFDAAPKELFTIAKASLTIGLLGALSSALQQTDRIVLRALRDESAVGIYSAASVLTDNFALIPDLFLGASFAAGMRLFARDRAAFRELYKNMLVIAVVLGLPIAGGVALVAPDLVRLVYRSGQYDAATPVLRVLVAQVPVTFVYLVATLPLLAAKRELDMVKLLSGSLVVNVVLNALVARRFGAIGSATATLAVTIGSALGIGWMTRSFMRDVSMKRVGAALLANVVMLFAAWRALEAGGMWLAIGVGAVVYPPLLVATRAFTPAELLGLLRRAPVTKPKEQPPTATGAPPPAAAASTPSGVA